MAPRMNTRTSILRHSEIVLALRYAAPALAALAFGACHEPNEPNLNGPSVADYSTITTLAQVQNLATGVLRGDRPDQEQAITAGEIMGRDLLNLTPSEDRWETELLGPGIDPSGFLGFFVFDYATVRLANIGLHGVSAAPATLLSAKAKAGTLGYLRTIKALEYLRVVETHDTAGAPINVDTNPLAPTPPSLNCKHDVLLYIGALLDSAAANLAADTANGGVFPFALPPDFAGFDTPAGFLQFNRALAAKADVYLAFRNYAATAAIDATALNAANTSLAQSFMVQDATQLDLGPAHDYSTNSGDATNGLFDGGPTTTTFYANARVRAEADAGDQRIARKLIPLGTSASEAGETSSDVYALYSGPSSPVKIITNKELLLLHAEVNWGLGNYATALAEADSIRRNDGGLTTDTTTAAAPGVLNRILYEKRYSLLFQSADRWIDARLFGKLNGANPPAGIGTERAGSSPGFTGSPLLNMIIPQPERDARGGNLTQACASGP
jgi:starch-binding outer membrane protein, SusD/RagB family